VSQGVTGWSGVIISPDLTPLYKSFFNFIPHALSGVYFTETFYYIQPENRKSKKPAAAAAAAVTRPCNTSG